MADLFVDAFRLKGLRVGIESRREGLIEIVEGEVLCHTYGDEDTKSLVCNLILAALPCASRRRLRDSKILASLILRFMRKLCSPQRHNAKRIGKYTNAAREGNNSPLQGRRSYAYGMTRGAGRVRFPGSSPVIFLITSDANVLNVSIFIEQSIAH